MLNRIDDVKEFCRRQRLITLCRIARHSLADVVEEGLKESSLEDLTVGDPKKSSR